MEKSSSKAETAAKQKKIGEITAEKRSTKLLLKIKRPTTRPLLSLRKAAILQINAEKVAVLRKKEKRLPIFRLKLLPLKRKRLLKRKMRKTNSLSSTQMGASS